MRKLNTYNWFIVLISVTFLLTACSGQASEAVQNQTAADSGETGEETAAALPELSEQTDLTAYSGEY